MALTENIEALFNFPATYDLSIVAQRLSVFIDYVLYLELTTISVTDELREARSALSCLTGIEKQFERKALHSQLTDYPLYTTLLLCPVPSAEPSFDETIENKYLALLARLFAARGASDYESCLAFDRKVLGQPIPLALRFILSTSPTLFQETIKQTSDNATFKLLSQSASLFIAPPNRVNAGRSVIDGANRYQKMLAQTDSTNIFLEENTDEKGDEMSQALGLASSQPLRDDEAKRQFQRKKTGLQRALYNRESKISFGLQAATSAELALLIDNLNPALLVSELHELSKEESYFFLLLFLRLWGVKSPGSLELVNASPRAKTKSPRARTIAYKKIPSDLSTEAKIILNAHLSKSQPADLSDNRFYKNNKQLITLQLPFPVQSLLNNVIRAWNTNAPSGKTLHDITHLGEKWYRSQLNGLLKKSGLKMNGITPNAIHNSFHQFASETVPESFLAFITGEGTIQSYYINSHVDTIETSVAQAWYQFIDNIGFINWRSASSETLIASDRAKKWHDDVGSPYTLHHEIHDELVSALIREIETAVKQARTVGALQYAFFYVYYRLATSVGLRPVKKPFPEQKHYNASKGIFTVADKRVHHPDERRLIVLTAAQNKLLQKAQKLALSASYLLQIEQHSHLLMNLNLETPGWEHFEGAVVERYLSQLTGQPLTAGGLRHQSAYTFINRDVNDYSQTALDNLLNHSRAGVSALGVSSLISIDAYRQMQTNYSARVDEEFKSQDAHFLSITASLLKKLL